MPHSNKNQPETIGEKSAYKPKQGESCWARLRTAAAPRWISCRILALSEACTAVRLVMVFGNDIDVLDCCLCSDSDVKNRVLDDWEFLPGDADPSPKIEQFDTSLCSNSVS